MRRTLAAAVFTALSIATAGAQLTIPKEYLPKVHGTIRSKYELQTTTGMQRFQEETPVSVWAERYCRLLHIRQK